MRQALVVVSAILCTFVQAAPSAAQKRPITAKDLFAFHWVGDIQVSPSGSAVAFTQTSVTPAHDGYQTSLYLLDLTTPNATAQPLTQGPRDSSPRWSPDGKQIAFIRSADKPGTPPAPPQLYLMAATPGASPIKLTEFPKGASSPQWAPNGTVLSVTSLTPQDPARAKQEATLKSRATGDDAHISDVHIINRAIYRFNGEGLLDPTFVPQVYMIYLPKPDGTQDPAWQLTGGRFGVQDYVWKPTSDWIFYTSSHTDEPIFEEFRHNAIYGIAAMTGAAHPREIPTSQFTDELALEASGLSISRDGNHLAFHAEEVPAEPASHLESDLYVLDLNWSNPSAPTAPAAPRNLSAHKGYEMGGGVGGDNTSPRGGGRPVITWTSDNSHLYDLAGHVGSALLMSVDATSGDMVRLTATHQAVLSYTASRDDRTLLALVSNPILLGEIFRIARPDPAAAGSAEVREPIGAQTALTHVNDALFAQLDLAMPQQLAVPPTVHASDIPFVNIDTFVQLPPGMSPDSKDPHPTILNIHGGPHAAYGWVFDHEMLMQAARGYVVIYPNPRGSTTYGQNFANIIMNNYPGDDFHDLMDTVDAVIAKGWADPNKLGVTGGSGGGLMTDWVVTQTTRFKAAVAQRDITDWANWWYTADAITFHQSFEPVAPPFDHVDLYRAHSPITFVNNIKTPMMFILGDADYRTPPTSGGEDFFRALKYKHIPTVMIRFPRESHELSRSGEPWHRIERLDHIANWFDKFLLGKCEPQYDIQPTCSPTP